MAWNAVISQLSLLTIVLIFDTDVSLQPLVNLQLLSPGLPCPPLDAQSGRLSLMKLVTILEQL